MLQIFQMRRFLALSILLHLLVLVSFINRKAAIIDDPIVAVSLDVNQRRPKASAPKAATAPTEKTNLNKALPANTNTETITENSINEQTSSSAYESGNVSIKPKVIRQIQVVYPQQAKEARVEGAVKLSVVINETGRVFDVTVLEGPGYGLDEAAKDALKQFVFSPAEVEGKKVPVRIVYIYRFNLESR